MMDGGMRRGRTDALAACHPFIAGLGRKTTVQRCPILRLLPSRRFSGWACASTSNPSGPTMARGFVRPPADDIFVGESRVAHGVADARAVHLTGTERKRVVLNPTAYNAYLHDRHPCRAAAVRRGGAARPGVRAGVGAALAGGFLGRLFRVGGRHAGPARGGAGLLRARCCLTQQQFHPAVPRRDRHARGGWGDALRQYDEATPSAPSRGSPAC